MPLRWVRLDPLPGEAAARRAGRCLIYPGRRPVRAPIGCPLPAAPAGKCSPPACSCSRAASRRTVTPEMPRGGERGAGPPGGDRGAAARSGPRSETVSERNPLRRQLSLLPPAAGTRGPARTRGPTPPRSRVHARPSHASRACRRAQLRPQHRPPAAPPAPARPHRPGPAASPGAGAPSPAAAGAGLVQENEPSARQ